MFWCAFGLRVRVGRWAFVFVFVFLFLFSACMISNRTVHTHGFTVQRQSALFTGPTTTLFRKNLKNESHGTIYTFKGEFGSAFCKSA